MRLWKFTGPNLTTRNNFKFNIGEFMSPPGVNPDSKTDEALCTGWWLHFFTNPHLAVFSQFGYSINGYTRLFECETAGQVKMCESRVKGGARQLKITKEYKRPADDGALYSKMLDSLMIALEKAYGPTPLMYMFDLIQRGTDAQYAEFCKLMEELEPLEPL